MHAPHPRSVEDAKALGKLRVWLLCQRADLAANPAHILLNRIKIVDLRLVKG
eukprot:m.308176 g.308176  ORF g.308176 m.308176 type:complete len:52 (+) comp20824_c0_seq1:242-397(+)